MILMRSFARHLHPPTTSLFPHSATTAPHESHYTVFKLHKHRISLKSASCMCLRRPILASVGVLNEPRAQTQAARAPERNQQALLKRIADEERRKADAGSSPDRSRVRALTWVLVDVEDEAKVEALLAGLEFPSPVYSSVIQKLGKEGRVKAASLLFRWLQKRAVETERANVYMYTSLLGVFTANGCVDMANSLVEEMREMGIRLNVVTYNTIINLFKQQGRFEEALEIFSEMQKLGFQPSFVTYSYVFQVLKKMGDFEDALDLYVKIKVLFDEKQGLLKGSTNAGEYHITQENMECMDRWVVRIGMKRILEGLCIESNKKELADIFQRMKDANLNIGSLDCRMLILHCGSSDEDYFLMKAVFGYVQERNFGLDVNLCNHMLRAYGEGRKYWAALEVFEHMTEEGPPPSPASYKIMLSQFHVLLGAACRRKIWKWALLLIDRMIDKGVEPDAYAWNMALGACSKAGKASAAVEAFQKMIERGAVPDRYSYGSLLSALEKEGLKEQAEQVWQSMHKVMVMPDDSAYTTMISLYGKVGEYNKAIDMFQEMRSSGISPTLITYNALITACARIGNGEGALGWFETMKTSLIDPDTVTYQELIKALASSNHWKVAATMYVEMQTLDLKPSCVAYDAVLKAYKAHRPDIDIGFLGPRPKERKKKKLLDPTVLSSEPFSGDITLPASYTSEANDIDLDIVVTQFEA